MLGGVFLLKNEKGMGMGHRRMGTRTPSYESSLKSASHDASLHCIQSTEPWSSPACFQACTWL